MDLIIQILSTAIAIVIAYFILERVLPNTGKPFYKSFIKYLVIFFILAVGFDLFLRNYDKQPKIITETINQLGVNAKITREIGSITGYSYDKIDLGKNPTYPLEVTCELFGTKKDVKITATVDFLENVYEVIEFEIHRNK